MKHFTDFKDNFIGWFGEILYNSADESFLLITVFGCSKLKEKVTKGCAISGLGVVTEGRFCSK